MRIEASPVRTLVIDEVSMMGAKFYARVEQYFRAARDAGDVAFGGINVYLFGDFSQVRCAYRTRVTTCLSDVHGGSCPPLGVHPFTSPSNAAM